MQPLQLPGHRAPLLRRSFEGLNMLRIDKLMCAFLGAHVPKIYLLPQYILLSKWFFVITLFPSCPYLLPPRPPVFANVLNSPFSHPVFPPVHSSTLRCSLLAASLPCDGPEAAVLSSPLSLPFPFAHALTPLCSAHTLPFVSVILFLSICGIPTPFLSSFLPSSFFYVAALTPFCRPIECSACQRHTVATCEQRWMLVPGLSRLPPFTFHSLAH